MTQQQREALDQLLRDGPLDMARDAAEQRPILEQMLTSQPLPDDVHTTDTTLGEVPAIEIRVGDGPAPATILYLHGGGFALGSARSSVGLASDVARRAGARALTVEYRLAPEHPYPAGLEDVVGAYTALLQSVAPETVALVGESAGGNFVMAALIALRDRSLPLPAGAVVFSPLVDLTLTGESMTTKAARDPALTADGLHRRVVEYTGDADAAGPLLSPARADLRGLPPLLIEVGSHEILLDDALALARRAAHDDVAVELRVTPGVPHVFQAFAAILDEGDEAMVAAGEFIRRVAGAAG